MFYLLRKEGKGGEEGKGLSRGRGKKGGIKEHRSQQRESIYICSGRRKGEVGPLLRPSPASVGGGKKAIII